jgi:uncharacterized protein
MQRTSHQFAGDTPGQNWSLEVLTYTGTDPTAPSAYLQAALHGSEFPGVAALHFLIPMLEQAEKDGKLRGSVTIVPNANPIGMSQWMFHQHMGRFEMFSRTNFNRDHALLSDYQASTLPALDAQIPADQRLKAHLLRLALPHDIILDLHCDDESEQYMYIPAVFWPSMSDLASALECKAVLTWDSSADAAFEEAAANPTIWRALSAGELKRRAVTTIEFGGLTDVSAEKGQKDAEGLYRFLVHRGIIAGKSTIDVDCFAGPVTPLDNVEVVRAPAGGMIFYHVAPGDVVNSGDLLVTLVPKTGDHSGDIKITAPQSGRILTRRSHRLTRRGDDLLKLLGSRKSATAKPGSLEA